MRRLSIALLSGLALLCMLIAGLCLAILRTATNAQLYSAGFAACADTQAMNVPASQYDAIAQALSRYFAGKADTPQAQILKGGALASAFNEKELQHLSALSIAAGFGLDPDDCGSRANADSLCAGWAQQVDGAHACQNRAAGLGWGDGADRRCRALGGGGFQQPFRAAAPAFVQQ